MRAEVTSEFIFTVVNKQIPAAHAVMKGSPEYQDVKGSVLFFAMENGTVVMVEMGGLPTAGSGNCKGGIFGFHVHAGESCTGNMEDPFSNAMAHFDTHGCGHPFHQGDMPVIFECSGFAFMLFYTSRFQVDEIIGRTVILHQMPDDFHSQPSGDSGAKIACGEIRPTMLWGKISV